jgi:uncharacterized membrane protein
MFDRAVSRIVAIAAASGAAVMAVFAAGFSLYALIEPRVGAAGASAIVALVAALIVALIALFATFRARKREREAQAAGHDLAHALPVELLGDAVRDRPLVTLAVTLVAGALAARNPGLVRDLVGIAARFTRERS